ncbi:MAG: hypothetical protein WCF67_22640 [Chitinophagaceae bacterium]
MRFLYVAVSAFFLLAACKKTKDKPAETPLPPAAADLSRTFFYPASNSTLTASYTLVKDSIVALAKINENKQLIISFDVPYTKGNDYILFTIEKDNIKPGYKGDYNIIHSELSGLRGDVQVNYRYKRELYSYVEFLPGNADGSFAITAYDETKKLVAGTYVFHINSFHDPKVGSNWVETKIDVQGKFENLQIK